MEKTIEIKCSSDLSLPLTALNEFQGDLKDLSEANYKKLRNEIAETGFAFAPHVWRNPEDEKFYLVDGHQRLRVLKTMTEKEGFSVSAIPVVRVEATDIKEAKRRVLQGTSQYGEMTDQGLYEFMHEVELGFSEINDAFRFPEIDMDMFKLAHFGEELAEIPDVPKESQHILEVHFSTESEMVEVYEELLSRGLIVKTR